MILKFKEDTYEEQPYEINISTLFDISSGTDFDIFEIEPEERGMYLVGEYCKSLIKLFETAKKDWGNIDTYFSCDEVLQTISLIFKLCDNNI